MQQNTIDNFDEEVDPVSSLDAVQRRLEALESLVSKHEKTVSLLNATLDSIREGILVVDNHGLVVNCNRQFITMWHLPAELIAAKDAMRLLHYGLRCLTNPKAAYEQINALQSRPDAISEDILELKDGRIFERISFPQKLGDEIIGRVWSFRDITARKGAEDFIQYQALYDALTDLPNRRLFMDRLRQVLARCNRYNYLSALLFIDLDNFKAINDTLGHAVGDEVLKQLAARLKRCLRQDDTAARLGGDEFVLLVSEYDGNYGQVMSQVQAVADKVLEIIGEPYRVDTHTLYVTPSIGVTIFPADQDNIDDVLMQADSAMYQAKNEGRNAVRFFVPSMRDSAREKLRIQNELHLALERKEFMLHWQPQFDHMGALVGIEALLRWSHPEKGVLEASEFIKVAEKSGMIKRIGDQVMGQACRCLKTLATQYPDLGPLRVAINISPQQFKQADFVESVQGWLEETGANPALFTLELTEGQLIDNAHEAAAKLIRLKKIGVRIAIDDFGVGFSSLAYLKRLPIDEIKIDESLVNEIIGDQDTVSIVEAIIVVASKLQLSVVAEGVECEEEFEFLKAKNCRYFQGKLFCPPLSEEALLEYLAHRKEGQGRASDGL